LPIDLATAFKYLPIDRPSFLLGLVPPALLALGMVLVLLLIRRSLGGGWLALALLMSIGAGLYGIGLVVAAPAIVARVRRNLRLGVEN
jgi:hypothetical protein